MHLSLDEITRLSPPERLALIGQLWDSLDNPDVPMTPAQQAEIDRRLQTFETDRDQSVTWESLKAELDNRLT
jgi:putative addiction module component (TIGR02574 family)